MSKRTVVPIRDRKSKKLVDAVLIEGVTIRTVELAELTWRPVIDARVKTLVDQKVPKDKWPQHWHWDWRRKHKSTSRLLAYKWFGIEYADQIQGLLLISTQLHVCKIPSQKDKPLVYTTSDSIL